jgi:hypothetical protein
LCAGVRTAVRETDAHTSRGSERAYDRCMHIDLGTVLAVTALLSALVLMKTDRMFALVAVAAAGIQTLMAFGIMTLTLAKFRIDVILPALLVVSGAVCWSKVATKSAITAATIVTLLGGLELMIALRVLT